VRVRSGFVDAVQYRAARIVTGGGTIRNQGAPGVVEAARRFLEKLDIEQFSLSDAALFEHRLNAATVRLRRCLPDKAQSWGIARKVLNIFLREVLYTSYLERHYRFRVAERLLELPLDSITAEQLKKHDKDGRLPRWLGIKHLRAEASAVYQAVAAEVAHREGIARVHLDTYWWGARVGGEET